MLPWLFGVLLVLNLGLFYLGYQRERAADPEPPPLPEGRYEIRLLSEVENPGAEHPSGVAADEDTRSGVGTVPSPGAESAVREPDAGVIGFPEPEPEPEQDPVESGRVAPGVSVPPSEAAEARATNAQRPEFDSNRSGAVAEPPGVEEIAPAVEEAGGEGALSPDELDAEPTEGRLEGMGEPSDFAPAAERSPKPDQ